MPRSPYEPALGVPLLVPFRRKTWQEFRIHFRVFETFCSSVQAKREPRIHRIHRSGFYRLTRSDRIVAELRVLYCVCTCCAEQLNIDAPPSEPAPRIDPAGPDLVSTGHLNVREAFRLKRSQLAMQCKGVTLLPISWAQVIGQPILTWSFQDASLSICP